MNTDELVAGIRNGDRLSLGRCITLLENRRAEKFSQGLEVLERLPQNQNIAKRVGVTGVPGVGKSTFIEALGVLALKRGYKVAVLAIDPSSSLGKGSILGDKTRMERLSSEPKAFIRPSPTGGILGGAGPSTPEVMRLCEAAGYDFIMVETVGVGQSETIIRGMVDMVLLLALANAGDELQGIKRGVMEIADRILINKVEEEQDPVVRRARQALEQALHLMQAKPHEQPVEVASVSALQEKGLPEVLDYIEGFYESLSSSYLPSLRQEQEEEHLGYLLREYLMRRLLSEQRFKDSLDELKDSMARGKHSPAGAAYTWVQQLELFGE